jgi:hypothetical protein
VSDEGAGTALAIGACNEDYGEASVRAAQSSEQRLDILQSTLDAEMTPFLKASDEDGLRVVVH